MSDAANDTISLMMQFGSSAVPAAEHLAEILLDAVQTLTKRGLGLGGDKAGQLAESAMNRVDGLGEHGQIALKNLVKQGKELMVIPVEREDLQTLKSQLKSYRVDFAIQEDALTGDISVHVKAQDLARIEEALKGIIRSATRDQQPDLAAEEFAPEAGDGGPQERTSNPPRAAEAEPAATPNAAKAEERRAELADRAATDKQMAFLASLLEQGVVSADEMESLGDSPTVGEANALLNAHREDAGFIDLGNEGGAEDAPAEANGEMGIPKGYQAEHVEILHGEDRRTFNRSSERPFVALSPNIAMDSGLFDAWYQRAGDGENRWMSDHTTSRDEFGRRIALALGAGKPSFEFEHETFDLSAARGDGAIAFAEHDWDEPRQAALEGDERRFTAPDGANEWTMRSERVAPDGHILQAYSNGRAAVLDRDGSVVWSACGLAGNIDASKRLADRGLETYQRKESLQLSPDADREGSKDAAAAFDATLDKAELTAAKEAENAMAQGLSHERERNAR